MLAAIAVLAVTLQAVLWMAANPLPSYWDEASYYASTVHFARLLQHDGIGSFGTAWNFDPFRPPIGVIASLPVALTIRNSLFALRLLSFLGFVGAALLIGATIRRVASAEAGALAVMMIVASPILVHSLKMFGTEYPLFLGIAGMLYFTFGCEHRFAWIGLGISIGLGLLAKSSFPVVALPYFLVRRNRRDIAGIVLGLLIATTWWAQHLADAIRFGLHSRQFIAHSLGAPVSAMTFARWIAAVLRCCMGYGIALILAITAFKRKANAFAIATSIAAVPLLIGAYSGSNHNPRLIAPAILLLIAAAASATTARVTMLATIAALQIFALTALHQRAIVPSYIWRGVTEVMAPIEQWDFHAVKVFVDNTARIRIPRIAVMGAGYQLNPANIEEAWLRDGVDAMSRTVWREDYELARAVEFASTAEVVITAPGFVGDPSDGQPRINAYNAEFARALAASGRFNGPFEIEVGVNEPARVAVFLRR